MALVPLAFQVSDSTESITVARCRLELTTAVAVQDLVNSHCSLEQVWLRQVYLLSLRSTSIYESTGCNVTHVLFRLHIASIDPARHLAPNSYSKPRRLRTESDKTIEAYYQE